MDNYNNIVGAVRGDPSLQRNVGTLTRTDEMVVIGEEKNGFINVQGSPAAGWVKLALVSKR